MTLSDRMKLYEARQQQWFLPGLPVIVRLDGKSFHAWTRKAGCKKPFDLKLMVAFNLACVALIEESGARFAATQSDEISLLLWRGDDWRSQIYCEGKPHRLVSVLASVLTRHLGASYRNDRVEPPLFDARTFSLPSFDEAANYFRWREQDAIRNSIAGLAQVHFSTRQLHGKSGDEMREMLLEAGHPWEKLTPREQRGAYFGRRQVLKELDAETLAKIPPEKRPEGPIERHEIQQLHLPPWAEIEDPIETIIGESARVGPDR